MNDRDPFSLDRESLGPRVPNGPMCSERLGTNWIDKETTSLSQSFVPGPLCRQLQKETITRSSPTSSPTKYRVPLSEMEDKFIDAFVKGLHPEVLTLNILRKINADRKAFDLGYYGGCLEGFRKGLMGLIASIVYLFKLPNTIELAKLAITVEAMNWLTKATHRELRRKQMDQARKILDAAVAAAADMMLHPDDYVAMSEEVGYTLGSQLGNEITAELVTKTAYDMGKFLGEIVGQITFEVVLQISLVAATEGIGNAIRSGLLLGEGTAGGSKLAQLAAKLRYAVRSLPGVERFLALVSRAESVPAALNRLLNSRITPGGKIIERAARMLERPTIFRHILTHKMYQASYAQILKSGGLILSEGINATYGEGVYAYAAGKALGSFKYIDVEVSAGVAVEELVVDGKIWYRLVPQSGKLLPVRVIGTNLTPEEIEFGMKCAR